ncbi:CPBP family intramembrane glutamic endopeptidase [Actinomadura welshii]
MRLLKQLLAVAAVGLVGGQATAAAEWNTVLTLVLGAATAALSLVVYAWVVRRTERRKPEEVALKGAVTRTGLGLLVGFGVFGAVIGNIAFLGHYRIEGSGSATGALALLGFMAGAAVTEEVIFRGVLFRVLEERLGTWVSLLLTGTLFGAWHMAAGVWGAIAIAVSAGGLLAAAYAATRNLWFPIGLHFAWNYAGAGIFGTDVSGRSAPDGLVDGVTSGPVLVSGGDFGPEASMYAIVFCAALTLVFMWVAHRRGRVLPRRRRAAEAPAAA